MQDAVQRWASDDLEEAVGTPGLRRSSASAGDDHWSGLVTAEPETMSGWHHHGEHTTIGYVVSGSVRLEFGPGGQESVDVGAGDFFRVPPGAVHREGNTSPDTAEAVVVRFGDGPPVFPASGPEPAAAE